MPFLDTNHQRAALLITLLSVGLAFALAPFATGLLGIPVLFVIFQPLHRWLSTRLKPALAAVLVVALAIILIVGPGVSFVGLVATEAQAIAGGVIRSSRSAGRASDRTVRCRPADRGTWGADRFVGGSERSESPRDCNPRDTQPDHCLVRSLLPFAPSRFPVRAPNDSDVGFAT